MKSILGICSFILLLLAQISSGQLAQSLLENIGNKLTLAADSSKGYEVRIPPASQQDKGVFTAKNFAIISMTIAFIYLTIVLVQVCMKSDRTDRDSELTEEFMSKDSLSYEYYYDEEYTNSQYLRSDDKNSMVDSHYRYDQSLKDSQSRDQSSNGGDSVDY